MKRFIAVLVLAFSFAAFAAEPAAAPEKDKTAETKSGKKASKKGEKEHKGDKADAEKKADAPKTETK